MEVARVQSPGNAKSQPVDDPPTVKFTWTIENFTGLNATKHYSDEFIVDGYNWRILLFPKGNGVKYLSIYLEVPDASSLPTGWSRDTQFSLLVVDQINNKFSVRKDTQHQLNVIESDWGFTSFMSFRDLNDSTRGYLVNDTIVIEAEIVVTKKGTSHGSGKEIFDLPKEAGGEEADDEEVDDEEADDEEVDDEEADDEEVDDEEADDEVVDDEEADDEEVDDEEADDEVVDDEEADDEVVDDEEADDEVVDDEEVDDEEADDEYADDEEADANFGALCSVGSPRRGVPSSGSSPPARHRALSMSPPRVQTPPRASPLPVSRDVDDEVAVVGPTPVIDCAPVPICPCPPLAPVVPPSPSATSSSLGTAAPPASIALPDDDDSDLALFESIGITFPINKPSWSTTFDTPTSSATNAKIPTSKRAEILKALSTMVCYLHNVRDLKDVDLNAEPPLEVSKALETLKAQGSDLLPKEKITMISKLSTDLARTVSRYKVRHDLLQGIATDKKDIEACTKAFDDADATIKTMSTDYWQARQQRDAKRKEFALAEDKVYRLQAELARAQEQASELQSQLTEAEQRRLTSFRACSDFKDTVYESARIERERVAESLELNKALYAKEKDDLDNAHDFLLDVISCLDTEVDASWPGSGISV